MTILGIITIITGITFLLNAYVFYVRFMQRKENSSRTMVSAKRGWTVKESLKRLFFYIQFILSTNTPKKHFLSN